MFNPLHSSTNQELFEKHLCYQNSHYENTDNFRYEGKPSRPIAKSSLFAVSKDEWDTKEDTGKSIVGTAVCQKAPVGLKQCQTVKKNQARSLSRYQVPLV